MSAYPHIYCVQRFLAGQKLATVLASPVELRSRCLSNSRQNALTETWMKRRRDPHRTSGSYAAVIFITTPGYARRSEHAQKLDVSGFQLSDGRKSLFCGWGREDGDTGCALC